MPRTRSIAWSELKLGIVGLVAMVLVAIIVVAIGGAGGFPWERYPLKTQFRDVAGLKAGGLVRLSGKDIGTVTDVEFAGPVIEVTFEVSRDVRALITTESIATIGSMSLLSEPLLDITNTTTGTPLPDWGYVKSRGLGPGITDLTATASSTMAEAQQLVADLRAGRGTLGKLFTDDAVYAEVQQLVSSAADVVDAVKGGRGTLGALTNDRAAYEALKGSVENLQAITARVNQGQGALGRLLHDDAIGRSIANTTANFEQTSARLNRGEGTLGKLMTDEQLYARLNNMAGRVEQVVARLEAGEGTAGKLLRDNQLYENMNRTITEIRGLFADVRKDPKKFLRLSVSIF